MFFLASNPISIADSADDSDKAFDTMPRDEVEERIRGKMSKPKSSLGQLDGEDSLCQQ